MDLYSTNRNLVKNRYYCEVIKISLLEKRLSPNNYRDLPFYIRRFSLESRLAHCHYASIMIISDVFSGNIAKTQDKWFPWEIEEFYKLSITAEEYGKLFLTDEVFSCIMNTIRIEGGKTLSSHVKEKDFTYYLFPLIGNQQFYYQDNLWVIVYRYNRLLSYKNEKVNIEELFVQKFGKNIYSYILFGYCFSLCKAHESGAKVDRDFYYPIFDYFKDVFSQLTKTRDELKTIFESINGMDSDSSYAYNPAVQFPFLEYDDQIFLPLPHIVMRSVSNSMYYRLTQGDDAIREKLGKDVLEDYLLKMLSDCNVYDECFAEQEYGSKRSPVKSSDVLARSKGSVLLIESKSMVPSNLFKRGFDENIDELADNVAKAVSQLYERAHEFDRYNPFESISNVDLENIWCCVAFLEESFIPRNIVYKKAAAKLEIEPDTEEYLWLINHVVITSFNEIDYCCLTGNNIIEALKKRCEEESFYEFLLPHTGNNKIIGKDFIEFKEKLYEDAEEVLNTIFGCTTIAT